MIELVARLERSLAVLGPVDSLVVLGEHFSDIADWFYWLHMLAAGTTVAAVFGHLAVKHVVKRVRQPATE